MREQMALDLGDGVDRDVDDDQQARPPQVEGNAERRHQIFGHKADEGQIGWVYADGVFTNPNPPVIVDIPALLPPTPEELMAQLNAIQAQIAALK